MKSKGETESTLDDFIRGKGAKKKRAAGAGVDLNLMSQFTDLTNYGADYSGIRFELQTLKRLFFSHTISDFL